MSNAIRATILTLSGLLAAAIVIYLARGFVYDDSYISFRYAWNLAHHGELVWNLGERVEGITNFLYTLALVPFLALDINPVYAARGLNFLSLGALIWATGAILSKAMPETESRDARAVGWLAVLGTAPVLIWAMGGLETVPVAAFLMLGLERLAPMLFGGRVSPLRALAAGLAFAAACLTRLDAGALVTIALAMIFLTSPRPWGEKFTTGLIAGIVVAVFVGAQILWRVSYYGELLPNTFPAKVGVPRAFRFEFGQVYLLQSARQLPVIVLALATILLCAVFRATDTTRRPLFLTASALVVVQILYVFWAGGDHLPAARFFVVAVAPAALVLALGFQRLGETARRIAVLLLPLPFLFVAVTLPPRFHGGAEAGLIVGRHLAETLPDGALVAVNSAGGIPYAAPDLHFVDQLGLNDRVIAARDPVPFRLPWQRRPGHAKGDGAYVLSREPDVIIFGGASGIRSEDALFLGGLELHESAEFQRCYALREEMLTAPGNPWLEATGRSEFPFLSYHRTC